MKGRGPLSSAVVADSRPVQEQGANHVFMAPDDGVYDGGQASAVFFIAVHIMLKEDGYDTFEALLCCNVEWA